MGNIFLFRRIPELEKAETHYRVESEATKKLPMHAFSYRTDEKKHLLRYEGEILATALVRPCIGVKELRPKINEAKKLGRFMKFVSLNQDIQIYRKTKFPDFDIIRV